MKIYALMALLGFFLGAFTSEILPEEVAEPQDPAEVPQEEITPIEDGEDSGRRQRQGRRRRRERDSDSDQDSDDENSKDSDL